jgi:hypothetical protein
VARWYCRKAHQTFSLLPDCLAARLSGALVEVETVARTVEHASSLEAAADGLRPDIELPGAVRWTRRRVRAVHTTLNVLRGLLPERFSACPTTVDAFRARLGVEPVLPALREVGAVFLHQLPPPIGLRPGRVDGGERASRIQHDQGPDPPALAR